MKTTNNFIFLNIDMENSLSLIIPCFNEWKNIEILTERIHTLLEKSELKNKFELLFVSDWPADEFAKLLKDVEEKYAFVKVILFPSNRWYGFSVVEWLKAAKWTYVGRTHADLQTDPKDVFKAFDIIKEQGYPQDIYVKWVRKNRPLFDKIFSLGMEIFESVYLRAKLHEINAQPNIFHRSFFEKRTNPPQDFSLDLYALYIARKAGLNLIRFDVLFPKRIHGQSNRNTWFKAKWKFIKRTLKFSKKLKKTLRNFS
jgi:hypothetical protein